MIQKNIKKLRLDAGYTLDNISAFLKIPKQAYKDKENGAAPFSAEEINGLCCLYMIPSERIESTSPIGSWPCLVQKEPGTGVQKMREIATINRTALNNIYKDTWQTRPREKD